MLYAMNLSWERSNDVLRWAVENQAPVRITVHLAKEWMEVASQLVASEWLRTLTIRKFPIAWNDRVLSGQLLPCSLRKGHKKYLFVSAVLETTTVEIDGEEEEAYLLAWPENLQQVQRRFYYRAAVPDDMVLSVRVWPGVAAIEASVPAHPPIADGVLKDISAGGALVELAGSGALELDRSYLVEIELPKPEKPVLVLGQVRRMEEVAGGEQSQYGLQFLSLDQSPRGRDTLSRLARVANYLRRSQLPQELATSGQRG